MNAQLVNLLYQCSLNVGDRILKLVTADYCQEIGEESLEWLLRYLAKEERQILFTGSRCYGEPREYSDFDWVYFEKCSIIEANLKDRPELKQFDPMPYLGLGSLDMSLRFGPVNLICVSSHKQWLTWKIGTKELSKSKVSRDHAVATFIDVWQSVEEIYDRL